MKLKKINKRTVKAAIITIVVIAVLAGLFMLFGRVPLSKILYRSAVSDINDNENESAIEKLTTALTLDSKNQNARFRLVEVYKNVEEYDKAEKLLLDGIEITKSNTKYYKELILLYVQSERVEKALEFINSIDHEYVLVQLNKERPKALNSSPTQGRYEKSINVTLSSDDEDVKIYYTTDGSTPNLKSEVYDGPIKIKSGNISIKAFAMNKEGLISDELILEYRVNTSNQYVDFADKKMEELIRREVNIYNQAIYPAELEKITSLSNIDSKGERIKGDIKSLEDLQWLPNLKELTLVNEKSINNISTVFNQKKLTSLTLRECNVPKDMLTRFSEFESLEYLDLSGNSIDNIEFIKEIKGLIGLSLGNNSISDLSPIEGLLSLAKLDVSNNNFKNISVLQKLYLIKDLNLSGNSLKNLNDLAVNTKIETLNVSNCNLKSLSGVNRLTGLKKLDASGNAISDFGDIKNCAGFDYLNLSNNGISNLSFAEGLHVKELDLSSNAIKSVKSLEKTRNLEKLDLSKNNISDVKYLVSLEDLSILNVADNSITELASLLPNKSLTKVIAKGNSISDYALMKDAAFQIEK